MRIVTGGNCLTEHGTTLGSSFRSDAINMERGKTVSFQIQHLGASCAGTLSFGVANFLKEAGGVDTTPWVPVTLASGLNTIAITGATNTAVDLEPIGFKFISVYWNDGGSDSNGDDTMEIYSHVKAQ